ncbi:PGF-pre-PGF domain-containing protein [Candidatus Pacearchaeota archaeon]|nr:PGF-pre-PGF domain-containing protein [Candidatus Pacearchaeota archaeon]
MTLIGGILLLLAISILAVYVLPNMMAAIDKNVNNQIAGNVTATLLSNTSFAEDSTVMINFSLNLLNTSMNISSINVTIPATINLSAYTVSLGLTTDNFTNATGTFRNVTNAKGQAILIWENLTSSGNKGWLIKGGQTKSFWFNLTADKPRNFNITVYINVTNQTGGVDNETGSVDGTGENLFDFGMNSTNFTIVVNDTTAPSSDVFVDLMGADSNTHLILANATPWINATKSLNISCNFTDNYNVTQVQIYGIPATPTFSVAGAPFLINQTVAAFGFNATALNINNTGLSGIDTSANATNYSMVRNNTILTTGKYLYYCTVTDNASNKANSTIEPFEITAWDVGGSVQNSTYNNETGVNVSIYEFVMASGGPPTEVLINSINSSATLGLFNLTEIRGNQSKPSGAAPGAGNYSTQYKIKLLYYTNMTSTNITVTEMGPFFPPMPKEPILFGMNNSVFYTKDAVSFRLCAFNDSNASGGYEAGFNYEISDDSLGYGVAYSAPQNVTCNTTIAVPQNRSYTISFMRIPNFFNGTQGNASAPPTPPQSIQFTNLTSYSKGKIIDVMKNLSVSLYFVNITVNFTGNNTVLNISNVSVYLVPHTGFITPNSAFPVLYKTLGGWANVSVSNSSIGDLNFSNKDSSVTFKVLGSSSGIEYFVIISANGTSDASGWMGNFSVTTANVSMNVTATRLAGWFEGENRTEYIINLKNSSGNALTSVQNAELQIKDPNFGTTRFVGFSVNSTGSFKFPILKNSTWAKVRAFTGDSAPVEWVIDLTLNQSNVTLNAFRPEQFDPNGNGSRGNLTSGVTIAFYKMTTACSIPYPDASCKFSSATASQDVGAFNPMQAMLAGKSNVMVNISTGVTMYFIGVDMLSSGPPDMILSQNASNQSVGASSASSVFRFGSMAPDVMDNVWVGVPYVSTVTPDSSTFTFSLTSLFNRTWGKVWDYRYNTSAQVPDEYVDYNVTMLGATGITCSKDNWTDQDCYVNTTDDKLWFRLPHFTGTEPTVTGTSTAGPGGGSGGGGGGGGESKPVTHSWTKITPGVATIAHIDDSAIGLKQIQITVKNQANAVSITITKLAGQPATIEKTIEGQVYKYMRIDKTNLTDDNIDKIIIKVMVEKSWIKNKSLSKDKLSVYRWDDTNKVWQELKTTVDTEDSTYVYLNGETTKLSYFAIAQSGGAITPLTQPELCGNSAVDSGENCANCPSDVKCPTGQECKNGVCTTISTGEQPKKGLSWVWWTVAIVLILIIVLIIVTRRKR